MVKPPIRIKDETGIKESLSEPAQVFDFTPPEGNFEYVISSGSTLLDLAISGLRIYGGGIPAGIILEAFGPPSVGKTALLAEIIGSCQATGGTSDILDPEARMDKAYMQTFGVKMPTANDKKSLGSYSRPRTVPEIFDVIKAAGHSTGNAINCVATDSLAALSTDLELDKGDKMGMRRGKEFAEGLRTTAIDIREKNLIIACSNQLKQGPKGSYTPGGTGIPFHASLRISMYQKELIERKMSITEKTKNRGELLGDFKKDTGVLTECTIIKSSLDEPYRKAPIYIMFNYGIDDIRGNAQFNKDVTKDTMYDCGDGKCYVSMNDVIKYVEANDLEEVLKERTRSLWYQIQDKLKVVRKPKVR